VIGWILKILDLEIK